MYKISQWRNNIHSYYSRGDYFRRLLGEANMEICTQFRTLQESVFTAIYWAQLIF